MWRQLGKLAGDVMSIELDPSPDAHSQSKRGHQDIENRKSLSALSGVLGIEVVAVMESTGSIR